MARYIDADWIYQMVENRYRVSSGIEHRCERDLLDLICQAPTADVVPKSEVEDSLHLDVHEALKQRAVENAKADVAREIFGEISKASVDWGCYCITTSKSGFLTEDVNRTLAELKKKYTEGNYETPKQIQKK